MAERDTDLYRCVAENLIGQDEKVFSLTVNSFPEIKKPKVTDITILKKDPFRLFCAAKERFKFFLPQKSLKRDGRKEEIGRSRFGTAESSILLKYSICALGPSTFIFGLLIFVQFRHLDHLLSRTVHFMSISIIHCDPKPFTFT